MIPQNDCWDKYVRKGNLVQVLGVAALIYCVEHVQYNYKIIVSCYNKKKHITTVLFVEQDLKQNNSHSAVGWIFGLSNKMSSFVNYSQI